MTKKRCYSEKSRVSEAEQDENLPTTVILRRTSLGGRRENLAGDGGA